MSSDEDEKIKFEITDFDLDNEFTLKRGSRLTKNQQIYGIWADQDDDNEKGGNKRSIFRSKKDYSAPVSFVTGGVHIAGKKVVKNTEIEGADEDDENEESEQDIIELDSSEEEEVEIRTSFAPHKTKYEENTGELAGLRKYPARFNETIVSQKGVGNWEKHTKGIGAKLLLQMGYQPGKGLGKDLQGINAPIEAQLRKGRGAIGAYGPEKKAKEAKLIVSDGNQQSGDNKDQKSKRTSLWRKDIQGSNSRKIHYVYKSVNDVIEENKRPGHKRQISELSKVKVIDMTGPEQRVLSGYHAISGVQKPAEEWEVRKEKKFSNFTMPELQHNLNLLVDLTEQAIVDNDQKLKQDEDKIAVIESQHKNMTAALHQEKMLIDNLSKMIETLDSAISRSKENNLTLEEASEIFIAIRDKHFTEYRMYEVGYVAEEVIKPVVMKMLNDWNPLEDPMKPFSLFMHWKPILQVDDEMSSTPASPNGFYKLVWETWVPQVKKAISLWSCREWAVMVELIVSWAPLLSKWILDSILQELILKKIEKEVEEWNPLTDCVPIHSWVYPWINFLGNCFESTVYPIIRIKLGSALTSWHPSDSSARLMLQPWVSVFSPGEMDSFIVNNIVPKLQTTLQEFTINPHQQHLDNWNWVMEWCDMISPASIAMLLDKCFFQRWIKVLNIWLNMNPDYDQVSRWYTGWKAMIPEPVLAQPIIKDYLRSALDLMSRSVGGPTSSSIEEDSTKQRAENLAEAIRTASKIPEGFKDLVQKRCEQRGILWMPVPKKYMEGKQIFRCGRLQTYIDKNVLFVSQSGGAFTPMSLQELLDNAI